MSASLRQIHFLFVVSFVFFIAREIFPSRARGIRTFYMMIVSHFSSHVNHVKLFYIVVFDLRSVRDPGLPPGAFALPRCAPQGGCDEGLDDGLMGVLMDGIE